jgi:O-6-methylguanine DNA methyltransferase
VLYRTYLATPLGKMLAVASADALVGLEFDEPDRETRLWRRLRRWRPDQDIQDGSAPVFAAVTLWLDAYFASRATDDASVPIDLAGTEFERSVWRDLQAIRWGQTSSYGTIAARLGRLDAARAVGAAVGANPVSLIVPCHRVVGADGSLTGYGGGLDRKMWLLRHEGARGVAGDLFVAPVGPDRDREAGGRPPR